MYERRLASIVDGSLSLPIDDPVTHIPDYVTFTRLYYTLHFLTNFDYWWRDIFFRQRFRVRKRPKFFVNWRSVDIFGIPTRKREELYL